MDHNTCEPEGCFRLDALRVAGFRLGFFRRGSLKGLQKRIPPSINGTLVSVTGFSRVAGFRDQRLHLEQGKARGRNALCYQSSKSCICTFTRQNSDKPELACNRVQLAKYIVWNLLESIYPAMEICRIPPNSAFALAWKLCLQTPQGLRFCLKHRMLLQSGA